jgi:acyl dehydratase
MNRKVIGKAVVVMKSEEKMVTPKIEIAAKIQDEVIQEETGITKEGNKYVFKNLTALKSFKGKSLGVSEWQKIDQEMTNNFAKSTLDFQWIHVDVEKAKAESPFGGTIAHGFNVLSFSPYFMYAMFEVSSAKMGLNYGCNKVRFISPTPVGSNVRMSAVLKDVEETAPNTAKLLIDAVFTIDGQEKPVCVAELISMVFE